MFCLIYIFKFLPSLQKISFFYAVINFKHSVPPNPTLSNPAPVHPNLFSKEECPGNEVAPPPPPLYSCKKQLMFRILEMPAGCRRYLLFSASYKKRYTNPFQKNWGHLSKCKGYIYIYLAVFKVPNCKLFLCFLPQEK